MHTLLKPLLVNFSRKLKTDRQSANQNVFQHNENALKSPIHKKLYNNKEAFRCAEFKEVRYSESLLSSYIHILHFIKSFKSVRSEAF